MKAWVLTCPDCGSADVIYEAGMVLGQKYRCLKCGYMGSLALEREVEVSEKGSGEHDA